MRKGALARIEVDRPLQPGGGTLRWLIPPGRGEAPLSRGYADPCVGWTAIGAAADDERVRMTVTAMSTNAAPNHWTAPRRSSSNSAPPATPTIGIR